MSATLSEQAIQSLEILKDEFIAAPIEVVFETILEQMGPYNEGPDGASLSMKLEAWPGGRWLRDFGNNSGHLWGHVQSIKAPTLLEVYGPMFMSSAVVSQIQYRLAEEGSGTRIKFSHKAIGLIPTEMMQEGRISAGWGKLVDRVRKAAEGRK